MRKTFFLLLIFFLSGCYDYKELNDIAIVKGAAIDIKDDEYILNYAIATPSKGNNESNITLLKGKGKTISEAITDINLANSKETYIGHLSILIISEDVAKIGMNDVTDYFFRNPTSKKTFNILLSKDSKAEDVLKNYTDINNYLMNENSLSSFGINTTLLSFFKAIKDPGIEPIVNGVSIENQEAKLDILAIFKNDKFVKWSDEITSKGLTILYNQSKTIKISTSCKDKNVVFSLNDIKIKKYFVDKNNLIIKITANTEIEEMTCDYNLKNKNDLNSLKELLINELEEILNKTIEEIKDNGIDSIGIGFFIYQNDYNKYLKFKNNYLNKIKINFEIKPNILANVDSNKGVIVNE